ncbi:MAG: hypothetical protein DCF22_23105, partial [Leptolyngbya sp.]
PSPAQLRPSPTSHKPASPVQSSTSTPTATPIPPAAIPQSNAPPVSHPPAATNPAEPTDAIAPQPDPVLQPSPLPSGLENTWQQVISQIQPYSTQVMVRQQCHLVGFDGEQARLAVSTQQLFKMAQGKLPNIEVAFEQVFGQKIRISLEVAAPGTQMSPTPQAQTPPPPAPPAKPDFPKPKPQTDSSTPTKSQSFEPPRTAPQTTPEAEAPNQSLEEVWGNEVTPPKNVDGSPTWKQDEVTDAAHRLADFFAGKVVDDDERAEVPINLAEVPEPEIEPEIESEEPTLQPWVNSTSSPDLETDLDDDDDIPF